MKPIIEFLDGIKTYLIVTVILVLCVLQWSGKITMPTEAYVALFGVALAALRAGVTKSGPLIIAALLFVGCANPQRTAYNSLKATAITVDGAMTVYKSKVDAGQLTIQERQKVRTIYDSYRITYSIACDALDAWVLSTTYGTNSDARLRFESFRVPVINTASNIVTIINTIKQ